MQAICRAGCLHPAVEKPLYRLWQALQMICRIRCSHRAVAAHQTIPANSARLLRADDKHLPLQTKSRAMPHNSKCRYGERGAAAAKPKAQIILDAAKVSAASGGNSEPKQGQRSQSARGFCPRSTMRLPQPDIIEHFGNADAVPHTEPQRGASERNRRLRRLLARRSAGAVLKPLGGNCAVLPIVKSTTGQPSASIRIVTLPFFFHNPSKCPCGP